VSGTQGFREHKNKHDENATTFMSTACCLAWRSLIVKSSNSHKFNFSFRYLRWLLQLAEAIFHPDLRW